MDIQELQSYNLGDAVKFNDKLNPRLWGPDEHLLPEVKEALMRIADDFREFLGITDLEIKDITVSGSNAAYTYTPHSDIDLHLVVDLPKADQSEVYRELFDAKKYQYNDQNDFKIGGADVELYVQNANEKHISQGIYSLMRDDWESVPKRRKPEIDDISVKSKYEDIGHRIEQAIASGDKERMDTIWHKVKEMRKAGLADKGEFSTENLAFKIMRNNGTLQKLQDARKAAKDQEMSLNEKAKPHVTYGHRGLDKPTHTPEQLARKHGVKLERILQQLEKGIRVEQEHTSDTDTAREIALDHLAELPDYYDRLANVEVREDTAVDLNKQLQEFIEFCAKKLKLKRIPMINIKRDPEWSKRNSSFGRYDPDTDIMTVSIAERHPLDIMRTIAHELAHRRQDETGPMPARAGDTGSEWENEANAVAGIIMRDFSKLHPEYFAVNEAAYPGNLGAMEMMKFYQVASDEQKSKMKALIAQGKKDIAWRLLQKVTGTKLEKLKEASGYIPVNDKEAADPRYSMALTVDIKPGETQRQAAKMGWKTDAAGVPPLLMSKLHNKLAVIKEGREIVNEEDLMEVAMSPGSLRAWAESDEAKGIRAGFEAEMIFKGMRDDDRDLEPDYDQDTRSSSISDVVDFFSNNDWGYGLDARDIARLREQMFDDYTVWRGEKIERDWNTDAASQIEDYLGTNVWGDDALREDMIMQELDDMNLSTEEIDQVLEAGESDELYQLAMARARDELEEMAARSYRNRDDYYDEAHEYFVDMMQESDDYDINDWLRDKFPYMTDVANAFDLTWPYWTSAGGERSSEEIGDSLTRGLNVEVGVSDRYHGIRRRPGLWIIEPDSSLEPDDDDDAGLEIVSPPMPLPDALAKLKELFKWAPREGAYTNESTGFHMGVSIPRQVQDPDAIDVVKLILFVGDKHVLEKFGRDANTYCKSALVKVKEAMSRRSINPNDVFKMMRKSLSSLAGQYLANQTNVGQDKYTSVHVHEGYIEFRSPGGDYLAEPDKSLNDLENTMLRFARAMQIAGDRKAETREYAKKLYKLIAPEGNDILKLFAEMSAGTINAEELKDKWGQYTVSKLKVSKPEDPIDPAQKYDWEVYNTKTGEVVDKFKNMVHLDATRLARMKYQVVKDFPYYRLRVEEPENKAQRRLGLASKFAYSDKYWKVTNPDTKESIYVTAKDRDAAAYDADLAASRLGMNFRNWALARVENKLSVERIGKKEYEQGHQQNLDAFADAERLKATVAPQTYNYEVTSRDGKVRRVQAETQVQAQQLARQQFPDVFGGPGSIADIRPVSGLSSTGEMPAGGGRQTWNVTSQWGDVYRVQATGWIDAKRAAMAQYPNAFPNDDTIHSVVLSDEPAAPPQQQPARALTTDELLANLEAQSQTEEPEYQIVHRRTGDVIQRFTAPTLFAAQREFLRITQNDPTNFGLYPVLTEDVEVEEGWRDWVAGAGLGAMALGGGGAAYDAYKAAQPPTAQVAQGTIQQQTPQKKQAALPVKKMGQMEQLVANTAQKAGITGTELKQFLAQVAHESADFTAMEEIGDDKYFAKKYDKKFNPAKAKTLGNVKPGDGAKYKGRGFIQLTGRYNYKIAGEALGLPLEDRPELAARPDIAAKIAVWFWQHRVQPKVSDFTDVKKSTKPINPALKGLNARQAQYDKYAQVAIPGVAPKKKV